MLATATACGAKHHDPYAASLASAGEHVEFQGKAEGAGVVAGYGDFSNRPDRGRLAVSDGKTAVEEVVDGHTLYIRAGGVWRVRHVAGLQTPAQMFRARVPAIFQMGLVHTIARDHITYTFSHYGERVSVHVPRVKGTK